MKVAGGKKDHAVCRDTFKDSENCWFADGCDFVVNHYKEYRCHLDLKDACTGKYLCGGPDRSIN